MPKFGNHQLPNIRISTQAVAGCVDVAGWPLALQPAAVARAMAESSGNCTNVNPVSSAAGLFQILPSAHPDLIKNKDDLLWVLPTINAAYGLKVYNDAHSWKPWKASDAGAAIYMAQAQLAVAAWHHATDLMTKDAKEQHLQQLIGSANLAALQKVTGASIAGAVGGVLAQGVQATGQALSDTGTAVAGGVGKVAQAPGVAQANAALRLLIGAGQWLSDQNNWLRIAYAVVGGALLIGGVAIVARPAVAPAVNTATKLIP